MFDLTVRVRPDADVRLQRHGKPRRSGAVSAGQCRCAGVEPRHRAGERPREHVRVARLTSNDAAQPGFDEPAAVLQPVLLRSRRRHAGGSAGHRVRGRRGDADVWRADDPIDGRRGDVQRVWIGRELAAAASACRRPVDCVPPARSTHRVRRIGRRRRAQRRHVHEYCRPVQPAGRNRRPLPDDARRRADAPLFPQQRTADDAVLQHRAGSARSPRADDRRSAGQQHDLAGRHRAIRRSGRRCFRLATGRRPPAFIPARSDVLFASFQSNRFFTNFRNGDPARWVRTDDPIVTSNERDTITASTGRQFITFDAVRPDTQFTAFQHVWRTREQRRASAVSGSQLRCSRAGRASRGVRRLGAARRGVSLPVGGSTPASTSRKPGDLTSDFYGTSRVGGLIVAAERTPADAGTLWAATSFGRLFVSKNASAPGADVQFVRDRLGRPAQSLRHPHRRRSDESERGDHFVFGLQRLDAGDAWPHLPRGVRSGRRNVPASRRSTSTSAICPSTRSPSTIVRGDLYAGTDFGPLVLRQGTASWTLAGVGFPEVLMVDLEIVPERRLLVAATHGLGIFSLTLPGDRQSANGSEAHSTGRPSRARGSRCRRH